MCTWYQKSWEKAYFLRKNGWVQHLHLPPTSLGTDWLWSLVRVSEEPGYQRGGVAPPSHLVGPRASPYSRVWTCLGWTMHSHCPAKWVQGARSSSNQWVQGARSSPDQSEASYAAAGERQHVCSPFQSRSLTSLLWVTSWECTSHPINHTNHKGNLRIC